MNGNLISVADRQSLHTADDLLEHNRVFTEAGFKEHAKACNVPSYGAFQKMVTHHFDEQGQKLNTFAENYKKKPAVLSAIQRYCTTLLDEARLIKAYATAMGTGAESLLVVIKSNGMTVAAKDALFCSVLTAQLKDIEKIFQKEFSPQDWQDWKSVTQPTPVSK